MSQPGILDKTYNTIITRLVATGQAPHYIEIAAALKIPLEEARKASAILWQREFRASGCSRRPTI